MINNLVLFPLKQELKEFISYFEDKNIKINIKTIHGYKFYNIEPLSFYCTFGGVGKVQFALNAHTYISLLKPSRLICLGSAGAISPEVRPLDVVIGLSTLEHDFKERFYNQNLPLFKGDLNYIDQLIWDFNNFRVHKGLIASGDEDIVTSNRVSELWKQTQAKCVAWEGAGGARAAKYFNTPFLEIRGITDQAQGEVVLDFENNLRIALFHIAELFYTSFIKSA